MICKQNNCFNYYLDYCKLITNRKITELTFNKHSYKFNDKIKTTKRLKSKYNFLTQRPCLIIYFIYSSFYNNSIVLMPDCIDTVGRVPIEEKVVMPDST